MLRKIDTPHDFFLDDPRLSVLGLADADLISLQETNKLVDRPESQWYAIVHDDETLGVLRTEPYNSNIIVHLYISSHYRSSGIFQYMAYDIIKHIIETTDYKTMIAPVPEPCVHVQKALDKIGFKLGGVVTEDYIWRDQKVNLLKYSKRLREEEKQDG